MAMELDEGKRKFLSYYNYQYAFLSKICIRINNVFCGIRRNTMCISKLTKNMEFNEILVIPIL